MTLEQIKRALREGHKVYWKSTAYEVIGDQIVCHINGHAIGLTWVDGITLNGEPEEFFIQHPV